MNVVNSAERGPVGGICTGVKFVYIDQNTVSREKLQNRRANFGSPRVAAKSTLKCAGPWRRAGTASIMPKSSHHSSGAAGYRLLDDDEPAPFVELGLRGSSNFVIVVDHASRRIPRKLGDLGLAASELERHIAWDIGALGVARRMAEALDAPLIAQNYSRLVIDANRDPRVPSSIPTVGESIEIPGNVDLSAAQIAARRAEIFEPYHARVRALLDERLAAGRPTILIAQHTMTNIYQGVVRDMHAAVLYNRDRRFAGLVLDRLRLAADLRIADNEPYFVSDETDYTVPRHAEARGLAHVEIEIRQDLVSDDAGQAQWAGRLVRALRDAEREFLGGSADGVGEGRGVGAGAPVEDVIDIDVPGDEMDLTQLAELAKKIAERKPS
jgi:predicted N-formylglutamate amidohydrolase